MVVRWVEHVAWWSRCLGVDFSCALAEFLKIVESAYVHWIPQPVARCHSSPAELLPAMMFWWENLQRHEDT